MQLQTLQSVGVGFALAMFIAACASQGSDSASTEPIEQSTPPLSVATSPTALSPTLPPTAFDAPEELTRSSTTPEEPIAFPTGIHPVQIRIPAIGVDATITGLDIRGTPEVPDDFDEVGWYTATRLPGEIGPSVVAGHIDSTRGPAVFFRLDELVEGDNIEIFDVDGAVRTFQVVGSGQYPKAGLPDEVFGFGVAVPELRLITCGGTFDRASGHYQDNVVVYTEEVVVVT